jgi:hypothetical protein
MSSADLCLSTSSAALSKLSSSHDNSFSGEVFCLLHFNMPGGGLKAVSAAVSVLEQHRYNLKEWKMTSQSELNIHLHSSLCEVFRQQNHPDLVIKTRELMHHPHPERSTLEYQLLSLFLFFIIL